MEAEFEILKVLSDIPGEVKWQSLKIHLCGHIMISVHS